MAFKFNFSSFGFFLKIDLKLTVKLQNDKVWIKLGRFVLINQQTIKLLILKDQLCDGNIVIKKIHT